FLNSKLQTWFRLLQEVGFPAYSLSLVYCHLPLPPQEFSPSDYRNNSVSSRTPTPPGRYSPHSPIDRDVPMSPRRSSSSSDFAMQKFDRDSEVYKMIQENKESRTAPRQSNTFKMLQEVLEADEKEAALRFPGLSPNIPKSNSSVGGVKSTHTCEKCGTGILTLAVRISDDRFRHAECYTCTDCGLNLKMRGHFCVGDVMYCEKHAKERYQGPGTSPQATISPRQ
ncbi:PDZ and LIM domain protein 2, partial [Notothenia coriiceps]|uniref:PDZ and LIM domain protein 2 n=1 Tax=Notothenia coriiceps TaxID=8208 RepID=A0A6I9PPN3_9TELE